MAIQLLAKTVSQSFYPVISGEGACAIQEEDRTLAFEALKSRSLGGFEESLGVVLAGYGKDEAAQLLALLKTDSSTNILIQKVLTNIRKSFRQIAFDALLERDLTKFVPHPRQCFQFVKQRRSYQTLGHSQ